MLKKILLISLVCIGLTAFMASQVSAGCCCNPRFCATWLRGSVEGQITVCDDIEFLTDPGKEIIMRLFSPLDTNMEGKNPLQGDVLCARDSIFPRIAQRRIEKCRRGFLLGCLEDKLCKTVPGTIADYDNELPFTDSKVLTPDDCDEVCCTVILEIEFEEWRLPEGICGEGWNYVGFSPTNPINEAVGVGIENKEYCPIIYDNVLQADACDLNGAYECSRVNPIVAVPDYPEDFEFGFGEDGGEGYGGFDVCNYLY